MLILTAPMVRTEAIAYHNQINKMKILTQSIVLSLATSPF